MHKVTDTPGDAVIIRLLGGDHLGRGDGEPGTATHILYLYVAFVGGERGQGWHQHLLRGLGWCGRGRRRSRGSVVVVLNREINDSFTDFVYRVLNYFFLHSLSLIYCYSWSIIKLYNYLIFWTNSGLQVKNQQMYGHMKSCPLNLSLFCLYFPIMYTGMTCSWWDLLHFWKSIKHPRKIPCAVLIHQSIQQ